MKKNNFINSFSKIHFIGVGGISMSALAKYCKNIGKEVSGSDRASFEMAKELIDMGINIYFKHRKSNVFGADLIVYSSAISSDNCELKYAIKNRIKVIKRSEFLAKVLSCYKKVIAVSGSHGKTTTTSMIAHVLHCAKLLPTAFIGGVDKTFSNLLMGNGEIAVAEACEYKKNILDISADIKVILNIDNDHLDSYGSMENMKSAFEQFCKNSITVKNADDDILSDIKAEPSISYGIVKNASYTAKRIVKTDNGYTFTAYSYGIRRGRIKLSVKGLYNVYNALACFAVCDMLKVDFNYIKQGLENFCSVKRRMEIIARNLDKKVICDYAHHPTEIDAVLNEIDLEKSLVIFQPHTYSRTKLLMDDFLRVLSRAKNLIIYKTYPAREKYDSEGDGKRLYEKLLMKFSQKLYFAHDEKELKFYMKEYDEIRDIIFIGAGDIYYIAKNVLNC